MSLHEIENKIKLLELLNEYSELGDKYDIMQMNKYIL